MQGDGVWTSVRELPVAMEYLGGVSLNNHILMTGKTRLPASRSSSVGPEGHFSFFHPKVKVKTRSKDLQDPKNLFSKYL